MNNIVQTKRTPVAGRRPTGGMPGELYFNFADRTIGCVDENGNPVDIATAISVSALPPASPVAGQLWYRTAIPAGLYIWFVDADSAQWVQVAGGGSGGGGGGGGGGASVEIGDTPPASPVEGQFWFSTVEPVGLFIWFVDADSAQWVQVGGSSAPVVGIPLGTVSYFASPNPPPGWLLCNGQAITTAYPELRQYLLDAGSPFGVSGADPRVPDLRGEFIRGFDGGRGVDAGRVFGSSQLDQLQSFSGFANNVQTFGGPEQTNGIMRRGAPVNSAIWQGATAVARDVRITIDTALDPTIRAGAETRPRNVALLPCIKAFDTFTVQGSADFSIATPEQAVEGTSTDTLMTPATARVAMEDYVERRRLLARKSGPAPVIDFTEFDHDMWRFYMLSLENVRPSVSGAALQLLFSADGGATWDTGATAYSTVGFGGVAGSTTVTVGQTTGQAALGLTFLGSAGNIAAAQGVTGDILMRNAGDAALYTRIRAEIDFDNGTGILTNIQLAARQTTNRITDGVRVRHASGDILDGTISMYGFN